MYCELKDKKVLLIQCKRKNYDEEKTFWDCSGCYKNIFGKRIRIQCDKKYSDKCLIQVENKI